MKNLKRKEKKDNEIKKKTMTVQVTKKEAEKQFKQKEDRNF